MNQIEQHIGWHDDAMLEFCAAHDILVQAATPLARCDALSTPRPAMSTQPLLAH